MKTSCLAALALLASAVHAAVPANNIFAQLGLEQPVPARNGNRLSHTLYLNDKEGGVLHFEFDVEHHENLFALDNLATAPVALECSDAGLRMTFASAEAAAAALESGIAEEGAVIAGGRHWGCTTSIMRKVVRKTASAGATVVLETVPASFEDAFNHADITFRTSMFPTTGFSQASAAEADEKLQRRFVADEDEFKSASLVPSYLKKAWSGIKDALVLAEKSMKAIYTTTKAIAKGDVEVAQTLRQDIFNFNYDRKSDHAATEISPFPEVPAIKCQNCYADFDLEVDFALKIASKKLKRIRTTIGGEASFVAESAGRIDVPLPAKFASFRKQIAEINAPPIVFDVAGVPFIIEFIVPIELGIDLTAEATGYVAAGVGAKGFLRFGFDYQGDWNSAWVVERGFSHFVRKPQLSVESIEAAMTVSLFPNLHVKLEHIGGPSLGLRLFSTVAAATADTLMCPGEPQAVFTNQMEVAAVETTKTPFLVSVDVGTQMLLGAFIDIKIGTTHLLKKEFTPLSIFSIVRRVSESCLNIPLPTINGVVETLPTEAVGYEGRAWYVDRLDCAAASASAGPAVLQMVGPTSVVLALNEEQGPCTAQQLYELSNLPAPGSTVTAKLVKKDDLNLVSCRSGSMALSPPSTITIEFGNVFNSIKLSLGNNCVVQMN